MEKVEKIKVQSDPYFGTTTLTIFPNAYNVSIVYGKNGSGKTSISNGINEYLLGNPNYSLLNQSGESIALTDTNKKRTFVFNEDYIDKKVKLSGDAIGAIILFGDTGDIESEIKEFELKIGDEKSRIESRDIEKYTRKGDIACLDDHFKKIEQNLQTNWALRQQKIKKGSRKSPVTESVVEEIIGRKNSQESKTELLFSFEEKLKLIDKAAQSDDRIPELIVSDDLNFNEEDFVRRLNKSYEKKEMSQLAQNLLISYEHYKCLEITKEMLNANDEFCPVCLRPIDKDYSVALSRVIDEAFDDTIRNAKAGLEYFQLNHVSLDLDNYKNYLEADTINKLTNAIEKYNALIDQYSFLREQKYTKIFDSVNTSMLGIGEVKSSLFKLLDDANLYIKSINEVIEKNRENIEELVEINKSIASIEAKDSISIIKNLRTNQKKDLKDNEESNTKIEEYKSEIVKLRAKAKDVHVAMKEINKELAIIFSSQSRLKLVPDTTGAKYYVESKGHKVSLNKLSTGERNLIALIYFFEEMKNECKTNEYFQDEYLIVIDDPISSFDYENKLGVYSYLNKMMGMVFNGNSHSQLIILSHERDVVYYLVKLLDKFRLDSGDKLSHTSSRINGKALENFNCEKRADYTYLLSEAFEFASIETIDDHFESKGNELRKLVEMYSTFNYKIGVDELLSKKEILANIEDKDLRNYFSNSMVWMPLNADSHTQELALQYPNFDTFDLFSEDEQIKVAREIICYLYLIHKNHITSHLSAKDVKKIEEWISNIKDNLT